MSAIKLTQPDPTTYGEGTQRLSQLSDLVDLSQDSETPSQPVPDQVPALQTSQTGPGDLQLSLPSQPLLPTPELPLEEQRLDYSEAQLLQPDDSAAVEKISKSFDYQRSADSMDESYITKAAENFSRPSKKVTRRGPMDEMRQLVRILVRIIPHSASNVRSNEEGGGGNRISERQIKHYLASTLGDAPQPVWGVPDGWGAYLAALFSWVLERPVTKHQAMRCAKRDAGRSWEAIDSELTKLGLIPSTWQLPLSQSTLSSALVPASQRSSPIAKAQSPKRFAETPSLQVAWKRCKSDNAGNELCEVSLWREAQRCVNAALSKAGSYKTAEQQLAVTSLMAEIHSKTHQIPGQPHTVTQTSSLPVFFTSQAQQFVPISVASPGGHVQTAYTLQPLIPTTEPLLSASQDPAPDQAGGLNPSQFLLSQPGGSSSAFQAVQPASPAKQQSQELLGPVPKLRLSTRGSLGGNLEGEPSTPSDDGEGNSASFYPGDLASPHTVPVCNLFKPTALKSDPILMERPKSQGSPSRAEMASLLAAASIPSLGCMGHPQLIPLSTPPSLQTLGQLAFLPVPSGVQSIVMQQPVTISEALQRSRSG